MTYLTSQDHAQETSAFRRLVYGMMRRVAITLTDGGRWQLLGQRDGPGGNEVIPDIPVFAGIGFTSRPPASGNPEAITTAVAGSKTTVVIATRDEATRQAVAGNLAPGETAIYNDQAILVVKANGTVEIRLANGVAIPLATKLDLQILRTAIATAPIAVGANGAAAIVAACDTAATAAVATLVPPRALGSPPWPIGTATLMAQ